MKRFICTMAGLMLTVGMVSKTNAQSAVEVAGSDTLYNLTNYLLTEYPAECGGDDPADPSDDYVVYIGGGSTTGENAMIAGTQDVAPMSRALKGSACNADPSYATTAEALGHSLDALSIYRSANNFADADADCTGGPEQRCESIANELKGVLKVKDLNGVPGIQCHGCVDLDGDGVADEYVFSDFKDVLAVAFGGKSHSDPGNQNIDCASDLRYTLAGLPTIDALGGLEPTPLDCESDCWESMFMKDGMDGTVFNPPLPSQPFVDCTDEKCNVNWHLWRRGDLSGTTDTFLSMVGIKSFCNGDETQDNDPIRRPVHDSEDLAGRTDMPMMVSPSADECAPDGQATQVTGVATLGWLLPVVVPPPFDRNTNTCEPGVFGWYNVPFATSPTCEDGAPSLFGLCLLPRDATGVPGCVNVKDNFSMFTPLTSDTRATNMVQRNTSGVIVPDEKGDDTMYAYYNIHGAHTVSTYVNPCNHDNSTDQIACLAVASPCTVGYAGMGATVAVPDAFDLEVNGVKPSVDDIRTFTYPLTRYLWLNSLVGFSSAEENQADLAACHSDRYYADRAAEAAGFVTLDANTPAAPGLSFVPVTDPCL